MLFPNNKYILYTKDKPIMLLSCERDQKGDPHFIQEEEYDTIRPFNFQNIDSWIEGRRAPQNRKHIKELLTKCGCNDLEGYIRFAYAAGLNDTFWIKPQELSLSWNDVSLYRNKFDENIARLAFGTGVVGEKFSSATPELATDGTFPKCWKRFGSEIYLLKQGSSGAANAGLEPYSEYYASQISQLICDNAVSYDLIRHNGKLASKCKLFTDEKIGYAPAIAVLGMNASLDDMLHFFEKCDSADLFRQMIVLDALTLNTDRHLKNFGVLYDNNSMKIIGMAPVFDNNLSLCPYATIEELQNAKQYISTRPTAIGDGFNEAALHCMTNEIRAKLYQVLSLSFDRTGKYNLEEERIELIEGIVHMQAENLLNNRVISIPVNQDEPIYLADLSVTFSKNNNDAELLSFLSKNSIEIPEFDIITDKGNKIHISDCSVTVNKYKDKIEISIYDSIAEGKSTSLHVRGIEGFTIPGIKQGTLIAEEISIQLNQDPLSVVTVLGPEHIQSHEHMTENADMNTDAKNQAEERVHAKLGPRMKQAVIMAAESKNTEQNGHQIKSVPTHDNK